MEVSSEAYLTNRIGNLPFDIAILTNVKKDHLDKHKSVKNYLNCKLKLFKHIEISIINSDQKYYRLFQKNSKINYSYGFHLKSDLRILKYKLYENKTIIWFSYQHKKYKIISPLLGKFNVYNVSSCLLTMFVLGFKPSDAIAKIKNIKQVKGRMEIMSKKPFVVLDYAHTTNATYNVLKYFAKFNKNIITVVGCAGDRYKEKRKEIGSLVLKYSKLVVFTMDDPRYEEPLDIIEEMIVKSKKKNYLKIIDRKEALNYAIRNFPNDLILILGKGRDDYMAINNEKIPYSDYETIKEILKIINA